MEAAGPAVFGIVGWIVVVDPPGEDAAVFFGGVVQVRDAFEGGGCVGFVVRAEQGQCGDGAGEQDVRGMVQVLGIGGGAPVLAFAGQDGIEDLVGAAGFTRRVGSTGLVAGADRVQRRQVCEQVGPGGPAGQGGQVDDLRCG